jgi:hypothetical protein
MTIAEDLRELFGDSDGSGSDGGEDTLPTLQVDVHGIRGLCLGRGSLADEQTQRRAGR